MLIEDGTGTGYKVGVDSGNRMTVSGVVKTQMTHASDDGRAFAVNAPLRTQTTTGGRMLYIKNTSNDLHFHIENIFVYYDGGATNHDKVAEIEMYFGDAAPSANNTVGAAGNLNQGSSLTADMDFEHWDEVGDGMTISGGTLSLSGLIAKGKTDLSAHAAIVLHKNDTLSINIKAEEIGEAGVNLLGYYANGD